MRRHHLIEEAKAELDIAYEEVKRAESGIMALEFEYNQKIGEFKVANGEACGDLITSMMTEKSGCKRRRRRSLPARPDRTRHRA